MTETDMTGQDETFNEQIQNDQFTAPCWEQAALLSIDLQNDFCDTAAPSGGIGSDALTVSNCIRLTAAFRDRTKPATHVVRLYEADGSNVDTVRRQAVQKGMRKVIVGSEGARSVAGLLPSGAIMDEATLLRGEPQKVGEHEYLVYKPRWGAFYRTVLQDVLSRLAVDTLVICGTVFPNCVRATIHQALERDYRVVVAYDAIAGIYPRGVREYVVMGASALTTDSVLKSVA